MKRWSELGGKCKSWESAGRGCKRKGEMEKGAGREGEKTCGALQGMETPSAGKVCLAGDKVLGDLQGEKESAGRWHEQLLVASICS